MKDGGPAFPVCSNVPEKDEGMRLRDWFAGQALAGIWAADEPPCSGGEPVRGISDIAEFAYDQADAMLEARKK